MQRVAVMFIQRVGRHAGQTVVLYFNVHDDGYSSDPTYMLLDDVTFVTG